METEREKRQPNMESHRTRGEHHTASARSACNSFPMRAFFFFFCSRVTFTAQGDCTVSPLHLYFVKKIRSSSARHVRPALFVRSLPQEAAHDREGSHPALCTPQKRRSASSSGHSITAHSRCARSTASFQKKKTLLKATAKTWLKWSTFLLGPLQCSFVFLMQIVL